MPVHEGLSYEKRNEDRDKREQHKSNVELSHNSATKTGCFCK